MLLIMKRLKSYACTKERIRIKYMQCEFVC